MSAGASLGVREAGLWSSPADAVFILAPPCTFSWVVCAMLGQHPQMYGLPELHLFAAATVAEWWDLCSRQTFEMDHGLVRTVAELFFGEQTEVAVSQARGWLQRRGHFTTGLLFEVIVDRVQPLTAVEKSPSIVHSAEALHRAFDAFPNGRFLHVVSHPQLYGESVIRILREATRGRTLSPSHWLVRLASRQPVGTDAIGKDDDLDPQFGWLAFNRTIAEFLAGVPESQRKVVRGEDPGGGERRGSRGRRRVVGYSGRCRGSEGDEASRALPICVPGPSLGGVRE
jgi:Sulfotransferase family